MAFLWDYSRNGRFVIRMGQPLQLVAPNGAVVEVVGEMLCDSAGELPLPKRSKSPKARQPRKAGSKGRAKPTGG